MTKYPTKDYNLGVLYPHLIDEFHPKLNDKTIYEYNPSSRQKLYWKCDKHDYYQQSAKSRSNGSGCPYCSGKKIGYGNDLKTKYPRLVKEWDYDKNINYGRVLEVMGTLSGAGFSKVALISEPYKN